MAIIIALLLIETFVNDVIIYHVDFDMSKLHVILGMFDIALRNLDKPNKNAALDLCSELLARLNDWRLFQDSLQAVPDGVWFFIEKDTYEFFWSTNMDIVDTQMDFYNNTTKIHFMTLELRHELENSGISAAM